MLRLCGAGDHTCGQKAVREGDRRDSRAEDCFRKSSGLHGHDAGRVPGRELDSRSLHLLKVSWGLCQWHAAMQLGGGTVRKLIPCPRGSGSSRRFSQQGHTRPAWSGHALPVSKVTSLDQDSKINPGLAKTGQGKVAKIGSPLTVKLLHYVTQPLSGHPGPMTCQ